MAISCALRVLGWLSHNTQINGPLTILYGIRHRACAAIQHNPLYFSCTNITNKLTTVDLIATCARQLQRCEDNLVAIHSNILKSCFESIHQFEHQLKNTIHNYNFALILRPYCNCTPHVWIYTTVLYISQWMNLDFQLTLCYTLKGGRTVRT